MINVDNCPNCNSNLRKEVMVQKNNDVYINLINPSLNKEVRYWYQCLDCNFLYRSPKLDSDEQNLLYEKYRDESFREESPDEYFERITQYSDEESENYNKISWFMNFIDAEKINKILDVGCGGGVLLHKIKIMIPDVLTYGIEPNELYSSLARERSHAEQIITSYFKEGLYHSEFDMIVSSDVLEHVDVPEYFLSNIYDALKSSGILFLEIPSASIFGTQQSDHDMFSIGHHVFYTKEILKELLGNVGFVNVMVEDIENINKIWKLRALAWKK